MAQGMERWKNRVALVTGASVGIGAVIAKNLVQHGLRVVACARNISEIEKAAIEYQKLGYPGTLTGRQCDLGKEKEIEELFEWIKGHYGGVDVCVNNAGFTVKDSLIDMTSQQMTEMLGVNVIALVLCASKSIKSMKERGVNDGHVFNINSGLGHIVRGGLHFYAATKFAVTALTEGFRRELVGANLRIRVTSISPGMVETEFAGRALGKKSGKIVYESRAQSILQSQDVADALIFALAAPENCQVHDILIKPTGEPLT